MSMSTPIITVNSSSKTGISNPPEIIKNSREASFSSYLDGAEESFVLKLGTRAVPHDQILLGGNRADNREIDVFGAEKYFNEGLNHSPKVSSKNLLSHYHKRDDPIKIFAIKEQPSIAPLSIRSESSWNSQRALLHAVSRNQQPRKGNKKSFLASIGFNCSCADNNSTDIDDCTGENNFIKSASSGLVNEKSRNGVKTSDHLIRRSNSEYICAKLDESEVRVNSEGHFSFPVFRRQPAKMLLQEKDAAAKRKPLHTIGSTMVTWDAITESVAEETKIPSIASEMHHDSDSDTSSDLFEIESLSKGDPFLSRQASDGCRTPTSCYAPSEASIEWSVVTASAADFSAISDVEEAASKVTIPCPKKAGINSKIGSFKEIPKLRTSILSGCKNHKTVSVAGDAHRPTKQGFSHARRQLRVESYAPMTRFHDESKLASFETKSRQHSFDARTAHLLHTR